MPIKLFTMNRLLKLPQIRKFYKLFVNPTQNKYFTIKLVGCSSFALSVVNCQGIQNSEYLKSEKLSSEQCIKQACLLSVNSASTLLTTTSSVLLEVCKHYQESLSKILSLLEEVLIVEGDNPVLWDAIVEARAEVTKAKAAVHEFNSYMESVEKVVISTTEIAFLAGAEYMCSTLCERLDSAQKEIKNQIENLKSLEEEYLKVQQEIVKKKKNKSN